LPGTQNGLGGTIVVSAPLNPESMTHEQLVLSRHSLREFSGEPVGLDELRKAIELAQHTPSACNRQGWRTIIVADRDKMAKVLSNQNGNRGFGESIDKLLVITADLCAQQRGRELFQAFVDGGMYAESILCALHSQGVASVPLSASLTPKQEDAVRTTLGLCDSEVLVLFVGVGTYPNHEVLTTRSERRPADITII